MDLVRMTDAVDLKCNTVTHLRAQINLVPISMTALETTYSERSIQKVAEEINFLLGKLEDATKHAVMLVFETGKRLAAAKEMLDHGQFLPWIEQNFSMSRLTANRYIRVYEHYKNNSTALLDLKNVQDAYVHVGVKRIADPKEKERLQHSRAKHDDRVQMAHIFRQPPRSGVQLKKYRVQAVNGQIYIYNKTTGFAAPALDLYLPRPAGLPEPAYQQAIDSYVIATELYLQSIEEFEERGIIHEEDET